jgi:hypothetical protein
VREHAKRQKGKKCDCYIPSQNQSAEIAQRWKVPQTCVLLFRHGTETAVANDEEGDWSANTNGGGEGCLHC